MTTEILTHAMQHVMGKKMEENIVIFCKWLKILLAITYM